MRVLWLTLAACGRIGFASQPPPSGDATLTDTAVTGDTTTDTAVDGPAVCAALFCDSFDQGIDGTWMNDIAAGSVAPAMPPAPVHTGSHSAALVTNMITSSTTYPRATLERFAPLPLAAPTIYARIWLYLASPFDTTATYAQFINFANSPGMGISVGARHGKLTSNDYTGGGYMESASTPLPLDRWFCLEMAMPNGSTDVLHTYVDGTEVTDIALTRTAAQPAPDHVYVGFMWVATVSSQAQAQGWLDDVAIGTSLIGCN